MVLDSLACFHEYHDPAYPRCLTLCEMLQVLLTFMRKCSRNTASAHEVRGEEGIELIRTIREAENV